MSSSLNTGVNTAPGQFQQERTSTSSTSNSNEQHSQTRTVQSSGTNAGLGVGGNTLGNNPGITTNQPLTNTGYNGNIPIQQQQQPSLVDKIRSLGRNEISSQELKP
jgi:hypothetical protein